MIADLLEDCCQKIDIEAVQKCINRVELIMLNIIQHNLTELRSLVSCTSIKKQFMLQEDLLPATVSDPLNFELICTSRPWITFLFQTCCTLVNPKITKLLRPHMYVNLI